jgi:RNA polymerase primary sigma factor
MSPESLRQPSINETSPFSLFLQEIGQIPVLTRGQEIRLGKEKDRGLAAQELLRSRVPVNGEKEQWEAAVIEGEVAVRTLVRHNLRWVVTLAKNFPGGGDLPDLVAVGIPNLWPAARKYDYTIGRFSTYATWWINQGFRRYSYGLTPNGTRISVHTGEKAAKVGKAIKDWLRDFGQEPTAEELAEKLGMKPSRVQELLVLRENPLHLDAVTQEGSLVGDLIADERNLSVPDAVEREIAREKVWDILNALPAREARVLELRFGLRDGIAYTLEQVGARMGITRERVRQLEQQGRARLLCPGRAEQLKDLI